jgi:hypothetical protein
MRIIIYAIWIGLFLLLRHILGFEVTTLIGLSYVLGDMQWFEYIKRKKKKDDNEY